MISECGMISINGKLLMPMDRINAYFAANAGMRVIARFEALIPGSTELQQSYYYKYVLPTICQAYREIGERLSQDIVEDKLFEQYPVRPRTVDGTLIDRGRDLDQRQMFDYLEWLKQFAAENLQVYIEDPKTL